MKNKQTKVKAILKSENSIIPITINPQPHCPVKYPFFYINSDGAITIIMEIAQRETE